tara:strand:- start:1077 stop:1214 length:138 start_codon:yes stop_codon:yes gene_type:complete
MTLAKTAPLRNRNADVEMIDQVAKKKKRRRRRERGEREGMTSGAR